MSSGTVSVMTNALLTLVVCGPYAKFVGSLMISKPPKCPDGNKSVVTLTEKVSYSEREYELFERKISLEEARHRHYMLWSIVQYDANFTCGETLVEHSMLKAQLYGNCKCIDIQSFLHVSNDR